MPIEATTAGALSYWSVHQRLRLQRGPASAHRCAECEAPAMLWSYDHTDPQERAQPQRGYRYSLDLDRYRPRCRSCHRRATTTQASRGARSSSVVDVDRARRLYLAGASARGIATLLAVSPAAVYRMLRAHGVPVRPHGHRAR